MTNQYPTLTNAPITEAIVDIQCKLPKGLQVDQFKAIGESISGEYPIEKVMHLHQAKIDVNDSEQKVTTHGKINGYRYESTDGKKIVQLRDNGFTYSRLKPYVDWNDIRDGALSIWNLYLDLVKPELINRIALRYINNLNAPLPMSDFKEYLTCPPEVPEGLPQSVISFFYRVVIPHSDRRITAVISQAFEAQVEFKDKLPIILDIDVFKITTDGFLEDDIVTILEKLRNFKNQIFFSSITKKLLETYI